MKTKLIVALVIVGVLEVTLIGIVTVSAQITTSTPTPNGITRNAHQPVAKLIFFHQ